MSQTEAVRVFDEDLLNDIIHSIERNDLYTPVCLMLTPADRPQRERYTNTHIKNHFTITLQTRSCSSHDRSLYRELLFLCRVALGEDNIDIGEFGLLMNSDETSLLFLKETALCLFFHRQMRSIESMSRRMSG